jgi:hypothetical protein
LQEAQRRSAAVADELVDAREQLGAAQRHAARLEARLREVGREKIDEVPPCCSS